MHLVNTSIASPLGLWLVGGLRATLGDSGLGLWVLHVSLGSYPVVEVLNLVLIQADIGDIFPECIYISCCVKSGKVGRCLSSLFTRRLRSIRNLRFVRGEGRATKDRIAAVFGCLFRLKTFHRRAKNVR